MKQSLIEYVNLATMSDADFGKFVKHYRELLKTLHSAVMETEVASKKG